MQGNPTVNVDAVGQRYTRSSGSYITDGFVAGMLATFGGFTKPENNGANIITNVAATTLTVSDNSLINEGQQASTTCVVRNSYARSAGSYIADGFIVGMLATFGGFIKSANNGAKIITTVTDTVLYASDGGLVNEGPIGNTTCVAPSSQAAALISLDQAIVSRIRDCAFTGARVGVRGQTVSYSNAILIEGCVFFGLIDASVYQPGQVWYLAGNTFEPLANLPPNPADRQMNAVLQTLDYYGYGVTFIGNWVGDGAGGFGSWVTLKGLGICIQGNFISGNDPDSVIKIGGSEGIIITGNRISGSIEFVRDVNMLGNFEALVAGNSHHSCTPIRGEDAGFVAGLCSVAVTSVENKLTLPVHYGQEFADRSKMSSFITGTFSWTPGPIDPGKFVEGPPNLTNNLNGARVGDAIHCGILPALPAGVIATAVMVKDNAVRVTIQNLSASPVMLGPDPSTVRVVAMK